MPNGLLILDIHTKDVVFANKEIESIVIEDEVGEKLLSSNEKICGF